MAEHYITIKPTTAGTARLTSRRRHPLHQYLPRPTVQLRSSRDRRLRSIGPSPPFPPPGRARPIHSTVLAPLSRAQGCFPPPSHASPDHRRTVSTSRAESHLGRCRACEHSLPGSGPVRLGRVRLKSRTAKRVRLSFGRRPVTRRAQGPVRSRLRSTSPCCQSRAVPRPSRLSHRSRYYCNRYLCRTVACSARRWMSLGLSRYQAHLRAHRHPLRFSLGRPH